VRRIGVVGIQEDVRIQELHRCSSPSVSSNRVLMRS
jgi:hypothetical protein